MGSGGERQTPDWYKEKGIEVIYFKLFLFMQLNRKSDIINTLAHMQASDYVAINFT